MLLFAPVTQYVLAEPQILPLVPLKQCWRVIFFILVTAALYSHKSFKTTETEFLLKPAFWVWN